MKAMTNNCATCKWFKTERRGERGGQCRVDPPTPLAIKSEDPAAPGLQVMPLYPPVQDIDGCSRHVPALVM